MKQNSEKLKTPFRLIWKCCFDAFKIGSMIFWSQGHFNECFPLIKVKVSTREPPYMSPLVKHLCNKRNKQIKIGVNPDIQQRINKLIRLNQIRSVNEENRKYNQGSRKWWDTGNRITGRKVKANNLSLSIDPKLTNHHFHNINTDPQYSTPEPLLIPEGTRIPVVDGFYGRKFHDEAKEFSSWS